jgi:hypothetical protein
MTEAQFTETVIELAKLRGWRVAHFRPARTSRGWRTPMMGDVGFPDLVLARKGEVIFAELKVGNNKMSAAQVAWADQIMSVRLWRPEHLQHEIPEALR